MDNMRLGWERPQEDEFALCNMGLRSPYEYLAFPNHLQPGTTHLNAEEWADEDVDRWKASFVWFIKCITYLNESVKLSTTHYLQ